jgi:hypothetical protein
MPGASIWAQRLGAKGKFRAAMIRATVGSSVLLVMDDVKQNRQHLCGDALDRSRM